MTRTRAALALLPLLALPLTACGGGSSTSASSATSSPPSSTSSDSSPSESTSDSGASNPLGTEATVNSDGTPQYTVTAMAYEPKVQVAYDDQSFLGLKSGEHWSRVKAKVCPKKAANVNWFMFSAIDSDGGTYKGIDQSFHDPFPGPLLPDEIDGIQPGPCRTGWVYVPVADGAKVTTLSFQDGDASVNWNAG